MSRFIIGMAFHLFTQVIENSCQKSCLFTIFSSVPNSRGVRLSMPHEKGEDVLRGRSVPTIPSRILISL